MNAPLLFLLVSRESCDVGKAFSLGVRMLLMVPIYALLSAWLKKLVPVLLIALALAAFNALLLQPQYEQQAIILNIRSRTLGEILLVSVVAHLIYALAGWGCWRLYDRFRTKPEAPLRGPTEKE